MNRFGDLEECGVACDDFPARIDAQVLKKRHFGAQDFRHAVSVNRRVQVQHAAAAQRPRQLAQFSHCFRADAPFAADQTEQSSINGLEHDQRKCVEGRISL